MFNAPSWTEFKISFPSAGLYLVRNSSSKQMATVQVDERLMGVSPILFDQIKKVDDLTDYEYVRWATS